MARGKLLPVSVRIGMAPTRRTGDENLIINGRRLSPSHPYHFYLFRSRHKTCCFFHDIVRPTSLALPTRLLQDACPGAERLAISLLLSVSLSFFLPSFLSLLSLLAFFLLSFSRTGLLRAASHAHLRAGEKCGAFRRFRGRGALPIVDAVGVRGRRFCHPC